MIAGYSPFYTNNPDPMALFDKIGKTTWILIIFNPVSLSPLFAVTGKFRFTSGFGSDLKNLVTNLLQTDITRRYGNLKNGVQDIKGHAWFKTTKWMNVLNREEKPPYVPKITGAGDCTNFDVFKDQVVSGKSSKCLYESDFAEF